MKLNPMTPPMLGSGFYTTSKDNMTTIIYNNKHLFLQDIGDSRFNVCGYNDITGVKYNLMNVLLNEIMLLLIAG